MPRIEPGPARGSSRTAAEEPPHLGGPLAAWRALDWRMLLPSVHFHRVVVVGDVPADTILSLRHAADVVTVLSGTAEAAAFEPAGADVVLVQASANLRKQHIPQLLEWVAPGGWLVLMERSRIGRGGLVTLSQLRRAVRDLGFETTSLYWCAPNFERCSYIVSLDDPVAIGLMLERHQGVRFGQAKAAGARLLLAVGAIRVIARDGLIVARRPA